MPVAGCGSPPDCCSWLSRSRWPSGFSAESRRSASATTRIRTSSARSTGPSLRTATESRPNNRHPGVVLSTGRPRTAPGTVTLANYEVVSARGKSVGRLLVVVPEGVLVRDLVGQVRPKDARLGLLGGERLVP